MYLHIYVPYRERFAFPRTLWGSQGITLGSMDLEPKMMILNSNIPVLKKLFDSFLSFLNKCVYVCGDVWC